MNKTFIAAKHRNKTWAIFDTIARVWYFTTKGKRACEERATALNEMMGRDKKW